jgi:glycosyltransferase involved in cell wall biosynthesis
VSLNTETLSASSPALAIYPEIEKAYAVDVSFVVPVYNEIENVDALVDEINQAGRELKRPYEIVIVDDGSSDGTVMQLRKLSKRNPELRVVCLKRNYGQTAATAAGFYHARGKYLVTLDGDLQNDPADVPRLIKMIEDEDLDIISGWRKNRQDKAVTRKLPSMIANKLISMTTGVEIHDNGCSLKVYRAEVAKDVPLYGEMHRFITALASIDGAVIKEVVVNHRPRLRGQSKYNLSRTFKVILDLMTVLFMKRFFTRPLHMFGRVGMAFCAVGALILGYLLFDKVFLHENIGNRPLLTLGALIMMTGFQFISTGLIAEIQVRTYFESQKKAIYKVKEIISA